MEVVSKNPLELDLFPSGPQNPDLHEDDEEL
jgi:hypothetical protein